MLIRAVRANDFMRFESLSLTDLPDRGVIGIDGPNESGKSTLGELIFFSFFGRGHDDRALVDLIRWGADSTKVEVEFSVSSDCGEECFTVYREVDRRGTNYVRILAVPDRREVASGQVAVDGFLSRYVGFDADEFRRAFYHDQHDRHSIAGSPVELLEEATGIVRMLAACESIASATREHEEDVVVLEAEVARLREHIDRCEKSAERIPSAEEKIAAVEREKAATEEQLTSAKKEKDSARGEAKRLDSRIEKVDKLAAASLNKCRDEVDALLREEATVRDVPTASDRKGALSKAAKKQREKLEGLAELAASTCELSEAFETRRQVIARSLASEAADGPVAERRQLDADAEQITRRRGRCRAVATLAFLLCIGAAAACVFAARGELVGDEEGNRLALLLAGAGAALTFLSFAWSAAQAGASSARLRDVEGRRSELAQQIEALGAEDVALADAAGHLSFDKLPEVVASMPRTGEPRLGELADKALAKRDGWLGSGGSKEARSVEVALSGLRERDRDLTGKLSDCAQRAKKRVAQLESTIGKLDGDRRRAESELAEFRSQQARGEELRGECADLELQSADMRRVVEVHREACRLLEEAVASVRSRLGPAVKSSLTRFLPTLTADRYRDVKVEEGLHLKIFSSDKSDFLELSEISGGTGEAIGLALKLALAEVFVATRLRRPQFLFLDEPFKMMDDRRKTAALRTLSESRNAFAQVWVTQPGFSAEQRESLGFVVDTSNAARLEAGGKPTGA